MITFELAKIIKNNDRDNYFRLIETLPEKLSLSAFKLLTDTAINANCDWAITDILKNHTRYDYQKKDITKTLFFHNKSSLLNTLFSHNLLVSQLSCSLSVTANSSECILNLKKAGVDLFPEDKGKITPEWLSKIFRWKRVDMLKILTPELNSSDSSQMISQILKFVNTSEKRNLYKPFVKQLLQQGAQILPNYKEAINDKTLSWYKKTVLSLNTKNEPDTPAQSL